MHRVIWEPVWILVIKPECLLAELVCPSAVRGQAARGPVLKNISRVGVRRMGPDCAQRQDKGQWAQTEA